MKFKFEIKTKNKKQFLFKKNHPHDYVLLSEGGTWYDYAWDFKMNFLRLLEHV